MINKKADEPANPVRVPAKNAGTHVHTGLTKREYFAAMAMQGLLAQNDYSRMDILANDAVKQADAILKELEK